MCTNLEPACLMANVFATFPKEISFDLSYLRKVRDQVTISLAKQNVVIDWTRNAVMGAFECYPDLFVMEGDKVRWKGDIDRESAKDCFDNQLPKNLVKELVKAIQEA